MDNDSGNDRNEGKKGLSKEIWGGIAKTKGNLRGRLET